MHDATDCPDESELAALLEGLADPALRRRIDAHIAGCSRCAGVLAAYAREATGEGSAWAETSAAMPTSHAADGGLADGATLGRFVVLGRLGAGAMGIVYLAYDRQLDRRVAIKLVRAALLVHPDSRARLLREAQAMARISHPNVIAVYEAGEHADQIYVVMELIRGVTLRIWLGQARGWREVLACFLQAGRGLAAAHTAGLVHRDFKPKSRRPSQTAPQPTDRPHSHSQGRFERVDVYRAAPGRSGVPQVLAKRWQRTGPPEDRRGLAPRHSQGRHHEPFPSHPFATAAPRAAAGR